MNTCTKIALEIHLPKVDKTSDRVTMPWANRKAHTHLVEDDDGGQVAEEPGAVGLKGLQVTVLETFLGEEELHKTVPEFPPPPKGQ